MYIPQVLHFQMNYQERIAFRLFATAKLERVFEPSSYGNVDVVMQTVSGRNNHRRFKLPFRGRSNQKLIGIVKDRPPLRIHSGRDRDESGTIFLSDYKALIAIDLSLVGGFRRLRDCLPVYYF